MSEPMTDERLAEIKTDYEDEVALHSMIGHGDLSRGWKRRVQELIAEVEGAWERIADLRGQANEYARLADIAEASRTDLLEQNERLVAEVKRLRARIQKLLPTVEQLAGSDPDFTGGLTTEEYIAEIRGK